MDLITKSVVLPLTTLFFENFIPSTKTPYKMAVMYQLPKYSYHYFLPY